MSDVRGMDSPKPSVAEMRNAIRSFLVYTSVGVDEWAYPEKGQPNPKEEGPTSTPRKKGQNARPEKEKPKRKKTTHQKQKKKTKKYEEHGKFKENRNIKQETVWLTVKGCVQHSRRAWIKKAANDKYLPLVKRIMRERDLHEAKERADETQRSLEAEQRLLHQQGAAIEEIARSLQERKTNLESLYQLVAAEAAHEAEEVKQKIQETLECKAPHRQVGVQSWEQQEDEVESTKIDAQAGQGEPTPMEAEPSSERQGKG